jgi:hypothetical protein
MGALMKEIDVEQSLDAIDWLYALFADHVRKRTIKLTVRTFVTRGVQYKCGDGPWRDTLEDAILQGQREEPKP